MEKKIISVNGLAPATLCGGMLFISGQIGKNAQTGELASLIEIQTAFAIENVKAVLQAAGMTNESLVKATVFIDNFGEFDTVKSALAGAFPNAAFSFAEVEDLIEGALVQIDGIAM